jgi:hypothetical protein
LVAGAFFIGQPAHEAAVGICAASGQQGFAGSAFASGLTAWVVAAAVSLFEASVHVAAEGHLAQSALTSVVAFFASVVPVPALTKRTTARARTKTPDKPIISFFIFECYLFSLCKYTKFPEIQKMIFLQSI